MRTLIARCCTKLTVPDLGDAMLIRSAAPLLLLVCLAAGCSSQSGAAPTVTVTVAGSPTTQDPAGAREEFQVSQASEGRTERYSMSGSYRVDWEVLSGDKCAMSPNLWGTEYNYGDVLSVGKGTPRAGTTYFYDLEPMRYYISSGFTSLFCPWRATFTPID